MGTLHDRNLLSVLSQAIREISEQENIETDQAFNRIAADWLGYDTNSVAFVDGSGDRGIDFWFQSDSGFDIFQAKSHDLTEDGEIDLAPFNGEGIRDLERIKTFLIGGSTDVRNPKLKQFRHSWDHAVSSRKLAKEPPPIDVNLGLVLLGDDLSREATADFEAFLASLDQELQVDGVPVQFVATIYKVSDLLDRRWRIDNREWRDITGSKKNFVDLTPDNIEQLLWTSDTAVFYCRALDLVRAYHEFGYQLFEPNVRCNINVSKVNAAIRETIKSHQGREEFRILNNGITIVCKNYQKPSRNKPVFRVTQPGIINGLQTVFAISEAYEKLQPADRTHFEENCFVLVRLLQEHAVKDVYRLVRATNTQNPMQPRNLVSNNPEQVLFEKIFAEIGWFYERKQGAWEAFAADPRRWRSLPNRTKDMFQFSIGTGRPRVRRVDNEILGQAWLSFIGYSEDAVHRKREIFGNDKWYDFIFLHTPRKHGTAYGYRLEEAREDSFNDAPDPRLMLIAFLAREFARRVAPTSKENLLSAARRLGIDLDKTPKEKLEARLSEDREFLLGQITNGMSYVFTEFVGLCLFSSLGVNLRTLAPNLLKNGSFARLHTQLAWDEVKTTINDQSFAENDILAKLWCAFTHIIGEQIASPWLESYRQARNRTRFNHSVETRERLHTALVMLNQYTERAQLARTWAIGIDPGQGAGLFGFIRDVATMPSQVRVAGLTS